MFFSNKEYIKELNYYVNNELELLRCFDNKKIVVTGASGLIGTYLIDMLMLYNSTYDGKVYIVAVDCDLEETELRFNNYYNSPYFTCFVNDINEGVDYLPKDCDYIVHAASNTSPVDYANNPVGTILTNVIGTRNLLEYVKDVKGCKFLFCSSVEVYGQNKGDIDEFDELYSGYVDCNTVRASYPSGKRAAESMCNAYKEQYDIKFCTARIGRIFGPSIKLGDSKAPSQFIFNAINGENILLKSDGMQLFSFGYVADCVTGLIYLLLKGENGEAYNIAGEDYTIRLRDFANAVASIVNVKCSFKQQNDIEKSGYSKVVKATMNISKIKKLGWETKTKLNDALTSTISILKNEIKEVYNEV